MFKKLIYLTCLILVLSVTGNALAELLVHYKLNETTGAVAFDSSGNGYDGTINGGSIWVTGMMGGALEFTGGENVTLPANDMGLSSDIGSVAFWMNADVPTAIYTIFWAGDNTTGGGFGAENEMHIHLESANQYWLGGELSFFAIANPNTFLHTDPTKGAAGSTPISPILLGDLIWHHVAATWGDGSVKLYVDGVLIWETAYSSSNYELSNIYLGQMANASRTYIGILDDVQIYNHALSDAEVESAMAGGEPPGPASEPNPEDAMTGVPRDNVILSWKPGEFADTHNVYFGTVADDVNNADIGSPLLVSPAQDANSYNLGRLEFGQAYFWRVDEVNAPPDDTVFRGPLWSFTIEPYLVPISGENITATASSYTEGSGPENTINGSGLTDDLHSIEIEGMWLTSETETDLPWIQYEFDKTYLVDEMIVWNYNGESILAGLGLKDVIIEYSTDGTNWMQLNGVFEFAQAPGANGYASDITVDFGLTAVKLVKISATSNWLELFPQYGLSEVRFMTVPVSAREPNPESEATDVAMDATLSWRAGREAAEHNVYISTDEQAVVDGTAQVITVSQASHGPLSLDLDTTYFWRVDEVNNAEAIALWEGGIWSFTTTGYLVVDDFESYNDIESGQEGSNLVYETWIDGYENPSMNGSTIGYVEGSALEREIVHGGEQSVPLMYDNTSTLISEVTVSPSDLAIGRDWAKGGARALVLWFYGDPNNSITEQMYVEINGTKVVYDGDPGDIAVADWTMWTIDIAPLGVNQSNVTTLTIGFERTGASGGSGTIFLDDILLYAPAILEQ